MCVCVCGVRVTCDLFVEECGSSSTSLTLTGANISQAHHHHRCPTRGKVVLLLPAWAVLAAFNMKMKHLIRWCLSQQVRDQFLSPNMTQEISHIILHRISLLCRKGTLELALSVCLFIIRKHHQVLSNVIN